VNPVEKRQSLVINPLIPSNYGKPIIKHLQANVFHGCLVLIIATVHRIGGSQDRAPSVQSSMNTCLCDGNLKETNQKLTEFHLILKEVGARRKNRSAKVIFFFA
jgi:hypothetical protein